MPASAAICSGQPIAILLTPERGHHRARVVGGLAGQVDRQLHGHPDHAGQREHPGQVAAQPDDLRVPVPRGRVAGDAADHEADHRPARPRC